MGNGWVCGVKLVTPGMLSAAEANFRSKYVFLMYFFYEAERRHGWMVENLPELMAQLELFQPACLRKWIVLGFAWALNAFK